jgi:hypothetical protein
LGCSFETCYVCSSVQDYIAGRKISYSGKAVFRSEKAFRPANLKEHLDFWENEILKDHPFKNKLMGWLTGVRIEEFLLSFTTGQFQGIPLNSYYPEAQQFENYVPPAFEQFMNDTIKEWETLRDGIELGSLGTPSFPQ